MKKMSPRLFYLLFFFAVLTNKTYADNFVTLNNLVSVNIPGAYPDTFSRGKLEGFKAYWKEYFYEAISMKDPSIKTTDLTVDELEKYYDEFQEKWLKQMGGKLKDQNRFYMKGFIGRHIYFEALNKAKLPQLWHTEIILLEKIIFVFSINAAKGKRADLDWKQNEYFGSLCLAVDQASVKQGIDDRRENKGKYEYKKSQLEQKESEMTKSRRAGERLRWMVMITLASIIFTAATVGIFFLIRHFYKKYD